MYYYFSLFLVYLFFCCFDSIIFEKFGDYGWWLLLGVLIIVSLFSNYANYCYVTFLSLQYFWFYSNFCEINLSSLDLLVGIKNGEKENEISKK